MAFEDEEVLLTQYNQWVAQRKVVGLDLSPTAFLVDRAKESAFETVMRIDDAVKALPKDANYLTRLELRALLDGK